MRLSLLLLISLGGIVGCEKAPSTPVETFQIRVQLSPGTTYRQRVTSDERASETVQGTTHESSRVIATDMTYTVEEVAPGGTMTLAVVFDALRVDANDPRGAQKYDSRTAKEVPPFAWGQAALVGRRLTITIDTSGKVSRVGGIEEMIQGILADPKLKTEATPEQTEAMLRGAFTEENLRQTLALQWHILPDRPVALGEEWTRSRPPTVSCLYEDRFTLAEVTPDRARIQIETRVTPRPDVDAVRSGPTVSRTVLSGMESASFWVDRNTGWIESMELTSELQGTVTVLQPQSQVIPIRHHGREVLETLD